MLRFYLLAVLALWGLQGHAGNHIPVLVVHSYSQEYPWTKGQHNGFVAALQDTAEYSFSFSVEHLDTKRIAYSPAYARQNASHIAAKYRDYRPRLIYVTDDNALSFAMDHLAALFPEAAVFFSGVNNYQVLHQLDRARFTGVFERKEIAPNLELMLAFDPQIRDILVVGDTSETFAAIRHELEVELQRWPQMRAHFISSDRIDNLTAALQARDERFVFLTTLGALRDAQGDNLPLPQTISAIVNSGDFTVFSMEDAYLFPGVVGGYVTSGVQQGQHAAALALRHLAGTPLNTLSPILASPNEYLIDATEMRGTGRSLPPQVAGQARLINVPPSFFVRNQALIAAALYTLGAALVLLLLGSLALLLHKNRIIVRSARQLAEQMAQTAEVQESLTRAQRIAGMGNWDWCIDEGRLYWSEGIYRLFGVQPSAFVPTIEHFMARVHPDDRQSVQAAIERALTGEAPYDVVHRLVRPGGEVVVVRENAEIVCDAQGRPVRMNGTAMDITEQTRIEAALRDSEAKLRTMIEGFPVVLWVLDLQGRFLLSEGKGLESLGLRPGQVVGQSVFEVYRDYPDVIRDARRALAGDAFVATTWIDQFAFEVHYAPLTDAEGRLTGTVGVAADVTERKRSEERLSFLANFDPITELPNRSLFNDRLELAMKHAERKQHKVALLFIDLDNFKTINDTLGHSQGDRLLQEVAQRLSGAVRASDTVSRLGGDEFTIILEDIVHTEEAARVAAHLLQRCAEPYRLQDHELYVTPSVGIALYPDDGTDARTLLMSADAAMYRAKENGRNGFEFFSREISDGIQQRLALSNLLRGALERREFRLHYQPQVDIRDGRIVGFEALLRWHTPTRGDVSPAVFIAILEETGLIVPVGEWVLQEACRWAAALATGDRPAPQIAVNLSSRQFRHPHLFESIAAALQDSGLAPARLELEITESGLVDVEAHSQTMDRLKRLGVQLGIDDFGTGYSSLSYLKRFPVDRLKIDASFVRDVPGDPEDAAIVKTIIGLGHNLGLKVIAEGVETAQQLQFLADHACDEIQGYLVARPLPDAEASRWFGDWRPQHWRASHMFAPAGRVVDG